jgi:hypothetical protein
MAHMETHPADPRDVVREVTEPKYRVYFWSQLGPDELAWKSDEWELTAAADVSEVLEWAKENSNGRSFVMYAVVRAEDGPVLVQLQGTDPTAQPMPK